MPAKKKSEKGAKAAKRGTSKKTVTGRAQATIDGVPLKNMSREQLEGHVIRLRNEMDREREERGFVQSELERVQRLWGVSADSLEDSRTLLRLKDAEMADAEKMRLEELRKNRQQMKAVTDQREETIGKLQTQSEETLLSLQKQHLEEISRITEEREELRKQLRECKASFLTLFANIKLNHSRDLEEMRSSFEAEAKQLEMQHGDRIKILQEELDLKRKSELAKEQEEKSAFLAKVIASHENEIDQIRRQSADVTNANLRLITQLRSQLAEQRSESLQNSQQTAKKEEERTTLREQLAQTKKKLADAEKLLERYKQLDSNMKTSTNAMKTLRKEKESVQKELDSTIKKYRQTEKERDDLYANFIAVMADVHQRSQMKTTLLEKRLSELSKQLEKRDSVLAEVAKASGVDASAYANIEAIIDEKNKLVTGLQEEVATMRRMYLELMERSPKSRRGSAVEL